MITDTDVATTSDYRNLVEHSADAAVNYARSNAARRGTPVLEEIKGGISEAIFEYGVITDATAPNVIQHTEKEPSAARLYEYLLADRLDIGGKDLKAAIEACGAPAFLRAYAAAALHDDILDIVSRTCFE